ncbi:alpha/beta hydrolase [Variovorax terrae]|uniref:Dienelactone hydrolase family protein n=1 Tax=Variovorax terrae TaxID=2923278 RepID=A0A9X1VSU5_9BURK|nr:dienelactone hydrolase family protein [Variovorax terrae]MCJ0762702.1 dienelactone hydrolase family protein [Variovorax terrae]
METKQDEKLPIDLVELAVQDPRLRIREFTLDVAGRRVPARLWSARQAAGPAPLVLVGHGGSGHKASQLVLDIAALLAGDHGFVVAAIDGPVHGARRASFADGPVVRQAFRELWAAGTSIDAMVDDWRAVTDVLCRLPEVDASALGWYGISMGTAYGIPVVAADARIRAAVLGMWGTCRAGSERLVTDGRRIGCPVLFQQKTDDEVFTPAGQADLYAQIGSERKELRLYPGRHTDPEGAQLADIAQFLVRQLRPEA